MLHGHADSVEEDQDDDEPIEPLLLDSAPDEEPEKEEQKSMVGPC